MYSSLNRFDTNLEGVNDSDWGDPRKCKNNSNSISIPGKYNVKIEEAFKGSINDEPVIKINFVTSDGKSYLYCYWLTGKTTWKLLKLISELNAPEHSAYNLKTNIFDEDKIYDYIYDHLIGLIIEIEFEIDQWHLENKGRSILKVVKYSPKIDLLSEPETITPNHQVTDFNVFSDEDTPF